MAACAAALWLTACGGGGDGAATVAAAATAATAAAATATTATTAASAAAVTVVAVVPASTATQVSIGEALFNDKSLSVSGQQACASCHATATAHADPAGTLLPVGGAAMDRQGFRSSPSLLYLAANQAFRFDADGQPVGGFTWDGRADSRQAQAAAPLLDGAEMANPDIAAVAAKLRQVSYFADFARLYKLPAAATDQQVVDTATLALATYQAEDPDYLLFNSKFDQVLDGKATLSTQEARGLRLFNDPQQGNCASCHSSRVGADGSRPLFTNFGYAALGLPRNPAIQANADAAFFDMGLCGPKRSDLANRLDLCGKFKVPTLRNVALTAPYFHNAAVATLDEAVRFYATRDIAPARWYPVVDGRPALFNDLPPALRGNVIQTAPFGLAPGSAPRLSAQDVADIVAFLRTLSDDVNAPAGSAKVTP
jgi:cytochrome c peroxidase